MLSAIVLAPRQIETDVPPERAQEAVVRSLAVLVGAAVADLVRDACIVGPGGQRLDRVADQAGCSLVEDDDPLRAVQAALRGARADHVFLLRAGYAPTFGFIDEMTDWLAQVNGSAAALRREGENAPQRLFPVLAPIAGVVGGRSECLALGVSDPARLARSLHAKTLRTRARRLV